MADIVRILGLDDDNHEPMFRLETGEIYDSPRELIEFLSHAHDVEYQVKMFSIIEDLSGGLADYEPMEVDEMFYHLEGVGNSLPDGVHPGMVFELFWGSVNRRWW